MDSYLASGRFRGSCSLPFAISGNTKSVCIDNTKILAFSASFAATRDGNDELMDFVLVGYCILITIACLSASLFSKCSPQTN